jgi:hypothetical protein
LEKVIVKGKIGIYRVRSLRHGEESIIKEITEDKIKIMKEK